MRCSLIQPWSPEVTNGFSALTFDLIERDNIVNIVNILKQYRKYLLFASSMWIDLYLASC